MAPPNQPQLSARVDQAPTRGTETVVLGCKLPNGLILRLHEKKTKRVAGPGGTQYDEEIQVPLKERVYVRGYNYSSQPGALSLKGSAYAFTEGVDAAFWALWKEQNADLELLQNHLIFAEPTLERARGRAVELTSIFAGFEALDMPLAPTAEGERRPSKDPRLPRGGPVQIETAKEGNQPKEVEAAAA